VALELHGSFDRPIDLVSKSICQSTPALSRPVVTQTPRLGQITLVGSVPVKVSIWQ